MPTLPSQLRSLLENKIIAAEKAAREAAAASLHALAVDQPEPFPGMSAVDQELREALRAEARRLGDKLDALPDSPFPRLTDECAYEQWHRMLFARVLAENGLLMHPAGVAVSLADCAELAREEGEPDAWTIAAKYAALMLPGIFRIEDPVLRVRLSPEGRHRLEGLLTELPSSIFTAEDSLGWCYQFWQTRAKTEVNKGERKASGPDISAVTQLFTEPYMVKFLLHNTLGAWWVAKGGSVKWTPPSVAEDERQDARTIPVLSAAGVAPLSLEYLRLSEDGSPAAGSFPGWPSFTGDLRMIDPCCGSGHFLVAAFEILRRFRMIEEGLSEREAADAVLRDNLHGLELDPRCTQIAAFALALAAWKSGGYRDLPLPSIACSGLPVGDRLYEWTALASGDPNLEAILHRLFALFREAPDIGSLTDPTETTHQEGLFAFDWHDIYPLLERAFEKQRTVVDPAASLFGAAARDATQAVRILVAKYDLVATNVPFLAQRKQGDILRAFLHQHYRDAKADLATAFVERCLRFCKKGGATALVTSQNWLFLGAYERLRKRLLDEATWNAVGQLGSKAFQTQMWDFNVALVVMTNTRPPERHTFFGIDASSVGSPEEKVLLLETQKPHVRPQAAQILHPNCVISLEAIEGTVLLQRYAVGLAGVLTGDSVRFTRKFWEVSDLGTAWQYVQSTVQKTQPYGGREHIIFWEKGQGQLRQFAKELRERLHDADRRGNQAWGKRGVAVSSMGSLPVTLYTGELFDNNTAVILPRDQADLDAVWAFCSSDEFNRAVRRIDQKLNVTNATMVKVPFDLKHWQQIAEDSEPLSQPHTSDPTQWLFSGGPCGTTGPLQVATARLLGYCWPEQKKDRLDDLGDPYGIACLPPVVGAIPAHERLRALLATAYGSEWSPALQEQLLAEAGSPGKSLELWLRDDFFTQHCRLFHNRPFIWHVWDGRKDGFSVLLNYHKLDRARLERLIYTMLGDWISAQREGSRQGEPGAEARLVAAEALKEKLEAILHGEPPYDIYVRWKPLHQQPIGWEPDLNDGVRVNIRPWVTAGVLRSRFTIHWKKDRGKNPDGSERLNDLHFTRAEKEARANAR